MSAKYEIEIGSVPDGSMVVGYVGMFKVLLPNGKYFWATRVNGVNDMEGLGMAHDMVNSFSGDLQEGKEVVRDE